MGVSLARQDRADGKILVRWWEWWWWWWKGERRSSRRLGPGDLMRTMHAGLNRPDCASVVATNVVARTALLNHSCSQHHRPRQRKRKKKSLCYLHPGLHALNLSAQAKIKLTLFFFFFRFACLHSRSDFGKSLPGCIMRRNVRSLMSRWCRFLFFLFLVGCLLVGGAKGLRAGI